jgi:hypothetical protein
MTAVISVDYVEFEPNSYEGVSVSMGSDDENPHRFATGNPVDDYRNAVNYAFSKTPAVFDSSTVHHFVSDTGIELE